MATGTSIFLSVAAVACVGAGLYYLYKKQKGTAPLKIEKVDSLSKEDVVAWFKSLNLDPTSHTPFICNNINNLMLKLPTEIKTPNVLLGVYNEKNNTLSPYRLLELKTMDPSLKEILEKSDNGLVVLS